MASGDIIRIGGSGQPKGVPYNQPVNLLKSYLLDSYLDSQGKQNNNIGVAACYLDGYMYFNQGASQENRYGFYKLNVEDFSIEQLANLRTRTGTSNGDSDIGILITDGTDIYRFVAGPNDYSGLERYRVSTNSWAARAASPVILSTGVGVCYKDGYIYVKTGDATFYRYSIASNTWTQLKPTTRTSFTGVAFPIDGTNRIGIINTQNRVYEEYDIATNTWVTEKSFTATSISGNISGPSMLLNGKAYFVQGGIVYSYDPEKGLFSYHGKVMPWETYSPTRCDLVLTSSGVLAFCRLSVMSRMEV